MADDAFFSTLPREAAAAFGAAATAIGILLAAKFKAKPDSIQAEAAQIVAHATVERTIHEGFDRLVAATRTQLDAALKDLAQARVDLMHATERMELAEIAAGQAQAETVALRGELRQVREENLSLRRHLSAANIDTGPAVREYLQTDQAEPTL